MLPTLVVAWGGGFGERHAMEGSAALLVLVAGLTAGALWQVLDRRDIADRLSFLAAGVCVSAGFLALTPSGYLMANAGPAHALAGVVAGAVLMEQFIRVRATKAIPGA